MNNKSSKSETSKTIKRKSKTSKDIVADVVDSLKTESLNTCKLYTKKFKDTNKSISKNRKLFFSAVLFDIFFFLIYGFVNESFNRLIQSHLEVMQTVMMTAQGVNLKVNPDLGTIIMNDLTAPYILNIIIISVLSVVSTYFLFTFFIGISNSIRININKFNREELSKYLKLFYKNMIAWFMVYILFNIITLYIALINTVRPTLDMEPSIWGKILPFIGLVLVYYFLTSYSNNIRKKAFRETFKSGSKFILRNGFIFIIAIVLITLIMLLLVNIGMLSGIFQAFISLVILSLMISYFLLYFNKLLR